MPSEASQKWSASASADPLNESCRGYLFKLKENKKDWKKLFVVLHGTDIIYYDNPHWYFELKTLVWCKLRPNNQKTICVFVCDVDCSPFVVQYGRRRTYRL